MESLRVLIEKYLDDNYCGTKIKHIDKEKVIFEFENSITLRLNIEELLQEDYIHFVEGKLDVEDVEDYFYKVELDYKSVNSKLKLSRGTGYKFRNQVEYLIQYGYILYSKEIRISEFMIGNVTVSVSGPSNAFDLTVPGVNLRTLRHLSKMDIEFIRLWIGTLGLRMSECLNISARHR